ncbi:MAG: catechol 1,2-dioxygenase, partial [Mesorhizobium sp.]
MVIKNESDLTPAVLAVMNRTEDPRLREILVAMVTHL